MSSRASEPARLEVGLFSMGTTACPVCGFLFSLTTDCCGARGLTCRHCRTFCQPAQISDDAVLTFSAADVSMAVHAIAAISMQRGQSTSTVDVDNRVIEEAFCDRCNAHRPCRTFARQTRSADEGQTIFLTCTVCKSEWSLNS
mmetsp:Transcript_38353/g.44679  ORF Transcript_38353/g.44679 Transcript_38353/m.44679 type:complete len:143 (+) Transcript_38353:191-619(+)